jgi:hypothetical protein
MPMYCTVHFYVRYEFSKFSNLQILYRYVRYCHEILVSFITFKILADFVMPGRRR